MNDFAWLTPRIEFGVGAAARVGARCNEFGTKAFLTADPHVVRSGLAARIAADLRAVGVEPVLFAEIQPEPHGEAVDAAALIAAREGCDFVLAVGGGSAMDFGKAVAIVARNPGPAWRYTRRQDHTPLVPNAATLPIVAVPTTAGTGSEATKYAVLTNPRLNAKSTIVHERIVPRLALVDPELTYSMPSELTAITGVDALSHAIESYITALASPFSQMVGLEAIRLIARHLPIAFRDGSNAEARYQLSWAATLAGIAISHAGTAVPHSVGQAVGAFTHASHGASVAACLAEGVRRSYSAAIPRFAEIACALEPAATAWPVARQAAECAEIIHRLLESVGCAFRFGDFGLTAADVETVAATAMTSYLTGIKINPRPMDEAEIKDLIRACL